MLTPEGAKKVNWLNKYIEEFSEYLTNVKKSSENTRLSYIRDISQFETYLMGEGIADILHVSQQEIGEYIKNLETSGKSDATILRASAALKSFYNYMILLGYIESSPVKTEVKRKKEKYIPEIEGKDGDMLVVRFCTSWSTKPEDVAALVEDIKAL